MLLLLLSGIIAIINIHVTYAGTVCTSLTAMTYNSPVFIDNWQIGINAYEGYTEQTFGSPAETYDEFMVIHPTGLSNGGVSSISYDLSSGGYTTFAGIVGLASDNCKDDYNTGSGNDLRDGVKFKFYLDDVLKIETDQLLTLADSQEINIDVSGGTTLKIEVDALTASNCDHSLIANPNLCSVTSAQPTAICPSSADWYTETARNGAGSISNCIISGSLPGIYITQYSSSRIAPIEEYSDFDLSAKVIFTSMPSSWASAVSLLFRWKEYCGRGGCPYAETGNKGYELKLNSYGQFIFYGHTGFAAQTLQVVDTGAIAHAPWPDNTVREYILRVVADGDNIKLYLDGVEKIDYTLESNMAKNGYSSYFTEGTIGFKITWAEATISDILLTSNSVPVPLFKKEPDYLKLNQPDYFKLSQSSLLLFGGLICLIVLCNVMLMCYINCNKSNKGKYSKVNYVSDSQNEV